MNRGGGRFKTVTGHCPENSLEWRLATLGNIGINVALLVWI